MEQNAVIPVNNEKKNNVEAAQQLAKNGNAKNGRERRKFKFGAEMNEKIVFVPQIWILLVLAVFQIVWTIIIYCVSGFWWQGVAFFLLPIPLIAAIFVPDMLNIKWHFLAQSCCWGAWAFLLFVYFFVCIYWYIQGTQLYQTFKDQNGEKAADLMLSTEYTPYLWFLAYVLISYMCICPVIFFLLRMTVHGFMKNGAKTDEQQKPETPTVESNTANTPATTSPNPQ